MQNQGITIRKKTPDILMIVNFYSPNRRYDDIYLSNYATLYVRDELLRVEGVSDITYQGQRDYSVRAWLDPQKLAACNLTAVDVVKAVTNQNLDAPLRPDRSATVRAAKNFQIPIDTLGRLTEPDQFGDISVKISKNAATATTAGMASSGSTGVVGGSTSGGGTTGGGASAGGGGTSTGGGATGGGAVGGAMTISAVGDQKGSGRAQQSRLGPRARPAVHQRRPLARRGPHGTRRSELQPCLYV